MVHEVTCLYFDEPGKANTDVTLAAAIRRAQALGIGYLLVASTEGPTGQRAVKMVKEMGYAGRLIVVTHQCGSGKPGVRRMPVEVQKELEAQGIEVVMATHALSGAERAFRNKYGGIDILEIVADTLRRLSAGVKVGVECALMAADAGMIPVDQDVVAVGGTSRGADTAIVVRPANSPSFFDLKVREIICMPR
ncbi:MAG: pyruvate kinase alpha/beta domain-containing protein [Chloroflexota bacterium]